jgi:hypothetical protein
MLDYIDPVSINVLFASRGILVLAGFCSTLLMYRSEFVPFQKKYYFSKKNFHNFIKVGTRYMFTLNHPQGRLKERLRIRYLPRFLILQLNFS